jgi:hypothetical protein
VLARRKRVNECERERESPHERGTPHGEPFWPPAGRHRHTACCENGSYVMRSPAAAPPAAYDISRSESRNRIEIDLSQESLPARNTRVAIRRIPGSKADVRPTMENAAKQSSEQNCLRSKPILSRSSHIGFNGGRVAITAIVRVRVASYRHCSKPIDSVAMPP